MGKWVAVFLLIIATVLSVCSQEASRTAKEGVPATTLRKKKPPTKPLSRAFAHSAFLFGQHLEELGTTSDQPLVEDDYDSSPFEIRLRALEKELEHLEAFYLQTKGDEVVYSMLNTAILFIRHENLMRSYRYSAYKLRSIACISDIKGAARAGHVTDEGDCTFNDAVRVFMEEEAKAGEKTSREKYGPLPTERTQRCDSNGPCVR